MSETSISASRSHEVPRPECPGPMLLVQPRYAQGGQTKPGIQLKSELGLLKVFPLLQILSFLGYDADPLLTKEVFTIEAQVVQEVPIKKSGYLE